MIAYIKLRSGCEIGINNLEKIIISYKSEEKIYTDFSDFYFYNSNNPIRFIGTNEYAALQCADIESVKFY